MMPVTPGNMLPLLDAPVPFILGMLHKTAEVAARCSGLVRVNVYKVGSRLTLTRGGPIN